MKKISEVHGETVYTIEVTATELNNLKAIVGRTFFADVKDTYFKGDTDTLTDLYEALADIARL